MILKEQMGARRFLLRGLNNVRSEFALMATAFNLKMLSRVRNKIRDMYQLNRLKWQQKTAGVFRNNPNFHQVFALIKFNAIDLCPMAPDVATF